MSENPVEITPKMVDNAPVGTEKTPYLKWFFVGILMMGVGWMMESRLPLA